MSRDVDPTLMTALASVGQALKTGLLQQVHEIGVEILRHSSRGDTQRLDRSELDRRTDCVPTYIVLQEFGREVANKPLEFDEVRRLDNEAGYVAFGIPDLGLGVPARFDEIGQAHGRIAYTGLG